MVSLSPAFERLCSLLMLILRISSFQILLTVSDVEELRFDLNSFCVVWCVLFFTGILAWYWLEVHLCKPHLPWIQWDLFFGNSESETESCVLFVFHDVSQMSTLVYLVLPHRFPFCQALAEALKTNTSVTSIDLYSNSIGDEGVKAFCFLGFQVAAHVVYVASLLKGFVVCSCSSFAFSWLSVKWVNFFLTWTHSICGMMWYAFYWDIGMILAENAPL